VHICGNLLHTFGDTYQLQTHLGITSLVYTFGDTKSFSHLGYHQLHAFLGNILSGEVTKDPYTPRSVVKFSGKYEVSSYPRIMIYRGAEFHLFWSRLSTVCAQYGQTPLILRQRGGEGNYMNIWAAAVEKTRDKVSHTQYEQDVWVRLASGYTFQLLLREPHSKIHIKKP
jgi:hypothetical protein